MISIVVPCLNEEEAIPHFYNEIIKISDKMSEYNFEYLFIDDGSTDNTINIILSLAEKDSRVKYISFSRNFGKESALLAGLEHAKGDYIVTMDADLQDPPSLLPQMIDYIINHEYDSVATRRITRKGEPVIRSVCAKMFYRIINRISVAQIVDGARDFRMMTRQMVDAILSMGEYNRFSKGIYGFVGFKTKWIDYENIERVAGNTKWSFWKLFKYSVEGITAFSILPLQISSVLGIILSIFSIIMAGFVVVRALIFGDPVDGWPSLMTVIMMIGGIQLLSIGILGNYMAKTYLETKKRPVYIIKKDNIKKV